MKRALRRTRIILLTLALASSLLAADPALAAPDTGIAEDQRILHALNRLGFGPRPGDIERVRALGVETYVERQLRPESIPDPEVDRRMRELVTLEMDPIELLTSYPPPQLLRGISRQLTTRMGMDTDSVNELFPELERFERAERRRQDENAGRSPSQRLQRMLQGPERIVVELAQAKLLRAVYSERQLQEVMTDFWFNHFNVFIGKGMGRWWTTSYEYDAIRPHTLGKFRDLLGAVARHPAMLFYLDNWMSTRPDAPTDNRLMQLYAAEAIRDQGLPPGGAATLILRDRGMDTRQIERRLAQREAMARRAGSRVIRGGRTSRGDQQEPRPRGLNENYARELLELHTLGVDGGYTQEDIVEVARCFTGWTLLPLPAGQRFVFVEELRDGGAKKVLGKKIQGKGMAQGEAVLDLLARHPATARFISTKLARRFVSDDPPATLIDEMSRTFSRTDGDIRQVLRTMFSSDEFWSPQAFRAKVKTPFEFVASLARATQADLASLAGRYDTEDEGMMAAGDRRNAPGLVLVLRQLGQPLYGAQPPTGYGDTAEDWVASGALLQRFKVAAGLSANLLPGVVATVGDGPDPGQAPEEYLTELGIDLMGFPPSDPTVQAVARQLDLPPDELEQLGFPPRLARLGRVQGPLAQALLLAAPEFQRR